jgi:hypothetical protein
VTSKIPCPTDPMMPTKRESSSHEARRDATGLLSEVAWAALRLVLKPMAPARSAADN